MIVEVLDLKKLRLETTLHERMTPTIAYYTSLCWSLAWERPLWAIKVHPSFDLLFFTAKVIELYGSFSCICTWLFWNKKMVQHSISITHTHICIYITCVYSALVSQPMQKVVLRVDWYERKINIIVRKDYELKRTTQNAILQCLICATHT